jgi:HPt (histidine-containing phosphotransfer) domain-containing protein
VQKWAARAHRFSPAPSARKAVASTVAEVDAELLDPSTTRTDRMWELFIQHSRDDIDFIQEAAAVEDTESLRLRSHRIKGSAYAFGARALGKQAAELERLAMTGNQNLEAEIDELVRVLNRTCKLMRTVPWSGARV